MIAPKMATVGEALSKARASLREDSEYPARDAVLLLAHVLDKPSSYPYLHPEERLAPDVETEYSALVERRKTGEPVAYLRGYQEFMGLRFRVDRRVLIPRPETEILVGAAAAALRSADAAAIADVCCGSGCIGLSLARILPLSSVALTDFSQDALDVARENAALLGVARRVEFFAGDLTAPLLRSSKAGAFDLVASNPPYIAEEEMDSLPRDVRCFEPRLALDGGPGGLRFLERLAADAPALLKKDGLFLMEIGDGQGSACGDIFSRVGQWRDMQVLPDYAGRQRVFRASRV
ncbi:MAG: peptide chain release factor N(5)-glutamine methyltransferase [Bacillota bacterium]